MNSTRIKSFVVCLGLVGLILTGNALAGTTTATEVTYAREVGAANAVYILPTNTITRALNVVRNTNEDFVMKVTLGQGALYNAARLPAPGDLALTTAAGCAIAAPTILAGGTPGSTFVDYFVNITTACTGFPTFTLTTTAWRVTDVNNQLGSGSTIDVTFETRDSATNTVFDSGTDVDTWLKSAFGVTVVSALSASSAVVDVATARVKLVATSPDTTTQDNGATIGIDSSTAGPLNLAGSAYSMVTADTVDLVITGDLSGITSITWDTVPVGTTIVHTVTAAEVTAGSATISVPGDSASLTGAAVGIRFTVDGTTALTARTLQVTVNIKLSGGTGGPAANDRTLLGTTNITVWTLNGTVLIANFANGNNTVFNTRVYLFNPSSTAGNVSIRVFTLPIAGGTNTLLGTVAAGSIAAGGGLNLRLAEDILTPLSITLPYTADGGNLVLEITIEASNVTGVGQVFNAATLASFGIFPLQ